MTRRKRSTKEVTIEDVAEFVGVSYATVSHVTNYKEIFQSEIRAHVLQAMVYFVYQLNSHIFSFADNLSQVIKLRILIVVVQHIGKTIQEFDNLLASIQYDLFLIHQALPPNKESTDANMMICSISDNLPLITPPSEILMRQRDFGCSFQ